jgi:hypothetical protein
MLMNINKRLELYYMIKAESYDMRISNNGVIRVKAEQVLYH